MEALVAVGLASNILQFIDFARSVVSDAKKFYENTSGAQDEYQEAEDYARRLQDLAAEVAMPQVSRGFRASREEKELKKLGEQCSQIANELLEATRKVTETSHNDSVKSAKKAVKARLNLPQIKALQGRLDRLSQQVTAKLLQTQLKNTERTLSDMAAESRRLSSMRDKDIRHLQKQLQRVTELLEKGESQSGVISLSGIAKTGTQLSAEQLILGRLFFHGMNERHRNIHVEHEETLGWIFEEDSSARFTEFLESESPLYWVSGKPGSGKSTAMKYICQHSETRHRLQKWAYGNRLIVAKFFFWYAARSFLLRSQEGLLRTMLYQIFLEEPALVPHAFPDDWAAYLSSDLIISPSKAEPFSTDELLAAVQLLCAQPFDLGIKICIFIDGLDEYDGRPADVIKLIEVLKTATNIKACVSSRPWNEFERAFGQDQTKKLYMQDLTQSDIRKYVRDTLEDNETFLDLIQSEGEDTSMELVHDIVNAAQGVFLWVILVVRSLLVGLTNADTFSNLQRRLRGFPLDLDEFFERILFSIDDLYSKEAAVMCLATFTATKPLPLMSYWFMHQDSSRYALDMEIDLIQPHAVNSRLKAMKTRLNACCKGLLEATHGTEKSDSPTLQFFSQNVQFFHRTVYDFLKIPRTRELLLDRLPKAFDPEMVICQALLAQIKTAPIEGEDLLLHDVFRRDFMSNFFSHIRSLEDERVPVKVEVEFLDEVRSTLQIQAELIGVRHFDFFPSYNATSFLPLCLELDLIRYIDRSLEREPGPSSNELSSMLGMVARSKSVHIWSESELQFTRRLFRLGADPNYEDPGGTPWKSLLDNVCQTSITERNRAIAFSILEEYTKNGASLHSMEELERSAYKDILKMSMTAEDFDALMKLADSEMTEDQPDSGRTKARIVKRLKRISGLRKLLGNIK